MKARTKYIKAFVTIHEMKMPFIKKYKEDSLVDFHSQRAQDSSHSIHDTPIILEDMET